MHQAFHVGGGPLEIAGAKITHTHRPPNFTFWLVLFFKAKASRPLERDEITILTYESGGGGGGVRE